MPRKIIDIDRVHISSKRNHRVPIGTRRPANAEVDPTGMKRFKHCELFGDDERCMIRQHHTARANTDSRR